MCEMRALLQACYSPFEDVIEECGGGLSWATLLLENDGDHAIKQSGGIVHIIVVLIFPVQSGLAMLILTSNQMSVPFVLRCECHPCVEDVLHVLLADCLWGVAWLARRLQPPHAFDIFNKFQMESLNLLCLTSLVRFAHHTTYRPRWSSGALHGWRPRGSCLSQGWPALGAANPNLRCRRHLKAPFAALANGPLENVYPMSSPRCPMGSFQGMAICVPKPTVLSLWHEVVPLTSKHL